MKISFNSIIYLSLYLVIFFIVNCKMERSTVETHTQKWESNNNNNNDNKLSKLEDELKIYPQLINFFSLCTNHVIHLNFQFHYNLIISLISLISLLRNSLDLKIVSWWFFEWIIVNVIVNQFIKIIESDHQKVWFMNRWETTTKRWWAFEHRKVIKLWWTVAAF